MKFQDYLLSINACEEARAWNADRDLQTCWQECERGDWMLWLMKKANLCDLRTLTLAKAKCAELAKPYMKDERSLAALRAAFDFANGLISEDELRNAAADAYAAYAAAAAYAAYAAAAAYADAYADAYAYADAAYDAAYAAARIKILRQCADICREVLPMPQIKM